MKSNLDGGPCRLFVYGSLAPGRPNEHVLAPLGGSWTPAIVRGRLVREGWGAALGYAGIVLDEDGDDVPGLVFTSASLAGDWERLDAFEGDGYERVLTTAVLGDGRKVEVFVYRVRSMAPE
jgi:gamma-glutamylcyclotransferase (GGCT)/AIG2-like uncharacterized protein YtfP